MPNDWLLYSEMADWFHLITAPQDYAEEAEVYRRLIVEIAEIPVRSVLELGSGGGNNASHLKQHFEMTLTDISPQMLEVSRRLNPECDHIVGDMTEVRLDMTFDAVFAHDAVSYLRSRGQLRDTVATARAHIRPGGAVLLVPDFTSETFETGVETGGHDREGRAARYLEWTTGPHEMGTSYHSDFVVMLREHDDVRVIHERHELGLFPKETWLDTLREGGFEPSLHVADLSSGEHLELFAGVRKGG